MAGGRRLLAAIARTTALITIPVAAFLLWVHPAILDPVNIGWLLGGTDVGQNALGLAAYLRAGDWPGTRNALLSGPEGVTLLFTDSNPLLGLLLWPVARWLPAGVQVIGLWLLLCTMLHAFFAWLLVRSAAPDFLTAWIGTALLTLLPTLFSRIVHPNLCAHWLILWALWLFIDQRRARSAGWWALLLGIAALVHAYMLVMVAAIWGSALLAALAERPPLRSVIAMAIAHALVAGMVVALMVLNGAVGGGYVSTGTFGAFPMGIDGLFNPGNPSYTALLPSTPEDHGKGYEGFQYLGAGLLLLVIAAVPLLALVRATPDEQGAVRRLRWLIPAFVVLTLLALGSHFHWQGRTVLVLPFPQRLVDLLDPVRAAGRLFWPVAYCLVFVAILAAYRLERSRALLLVAAAFALQIIDIAPMFAAIRTVTATADNRETYHRTHDARWPAIIAAAQVIEFHPPSVTEDLQLLQEISWRAMLACRPTSFTYAARETDETRARLARAVAALASGRIDPTHLYILFKPVRVPPALKARVQTLDGVSFIPANGSGKPLKGCRANISPPR